MHIFLVIFWAFLSFFFLFFCLWRKRNKWFQPIRRSKYTTLGESHTRLFCITIATGLTITGRHLMIDPIVVPNLVSFQFSRMSMPPKIFPTVSLLGPVSTGGGTSKSSLPSLLVNGHDLPMAWRSSWKKYNFICAGKSYTRGRIR